MVVFKNETWILFHPNLMSVSENGSPGGAKDGKGPLSDILASVHSVAMNETRLNIWPNDDLVFSYALSTRRCKFKHIIENMYSR